MSIDSRGKKKAANKSGRKALLLKAVNWFLMSVLAAVVLVSMGIFLAPRFGWDLNVVNGASMEPAITMGSLAVVRPIDPHNINEGDIILYRTSSSSNKFTTHRVYEVISNDGIFTFRTKGDANEKPDSDFIKSENIIGEVWITVPHVGYVMEFIRKPIGFGFIFGIPATLLVILELRNIYRNTKIIRRRNAVRRNKGIKDKRLRQAAE